MLNAEAAPNRSWPFRLATPWSCSIADFSWLARDWGGSICRSPATSTTPMIATFVSIAIETKIDLRRLI
jgi:hypothetical protein